MMQRGSSEGAFVNVRNGRAYLASLRDDRQVFIDGGRAADVGAHPAFRHAVASFAGLYDFQARPENAALMTFASPGSGRRVNRAWQLPTCHDELVARRQAIEAWAQLHHGFFGRSPDHLACALGAMVVGIDVFRRNGKGRAQALLDYFAHARDNDLFVSYVIQNPQADKTQGPSGQARDLVARVVKQDSEGITLRGVKMLGTSAVMADELLVANIQPLRPGEERYAFSCALPVATPGLRLLSRRSYEQAATSPFDYPLSSRFDENDAIVHFDDVQVPWERVFLLGDVDAMRAQWADTPAHVVQNYQSQVRLMVKLRFLVGLARRIAETNSSIELPPVRAQLGELAAQAALVEGLVYGMEAACVRVGDYVAPPAHLLYAAQVHTQALYPRFVEAIRGIAGGGLIMLPSSASDFADPALARLIEDSQVSAVTDALGRVKVFKLAWDALGSEFASRHLQYEMFYGGAPYVTQANMYRTYDWQGPLAQVDRALATMQLPEPPDGH